MKKIDEKNVVQKPPPVNRLSRGRKRPKNLASFDLTDEVLAKIARDAHGERMRLGANAPKNAAGLTFYLWFVTRLRDYLLGLGNGWEARTVDGLEVVEHAERHLRVAYMMAETLDASLVSSYRGPASLAAADNNGQLALLGREFLAPQARSGRAGATPIAKYETWFLAVHRGTGTYRLELALPTDAHAGRFVDWAERIPVAEVQLDSEPKLDVSGAAPVAAPLPKARRRRKGLPANDIEPINTGTDGDPQK